MTERLKRDPIARTVEDLDRSRRWVVVLAAVVAVLAVAVVVMAFALHDLTGYVKQPGGRENRLQYQCSVERRLQLPEVDCNG